jgi:hypothetical protein
VRKISRKLAVSTALLLTLGTSAFAQQSFFSPNVAGINPSSVRPGVNPWMEAWSGFAFQNNFYGGYVGANVALNPKRDIWDEGFVLRFEGVAGHYDYASSIVPSGEVNVLTHGATMMFGYRKKVGEGLLTAYLGANYEHHNTPDPTAQIRGTEVGAKTLVEYYAAYGPGKNYDFYGQAAYSSAFDTWWVYVAPGYQISPKIWIGPEAQVGGNRAYEEARVGGWARFETPYPMLSNVTLAVGYRDPITSGVATGYYARINMNYVFR